MGTKETVGNANLDAAQALAEQQQALLEQSRGAFEEVHRRHRQFCLETTRFIAHRLSADQEVCTDVMALMHAGKPDHAMRLWTEFLSQAAGDYTAVCARLAAIGVGANETKGTA